MKELAFFLRAHRASKKIFSKNLCGAITGGSASPEDDGKRLPECGNIRQNRSSSPSASRSGRGDPSTIARRYGRGAGVGRGLGSGLDLGVGVGRGVAVGVVLGVAVEVAVGVTVAVAVGLTLAVAVGVGVGVAPPAGACIATVIGEPVLKKPTVALVSCGG